MDADQIARIEAHILRKAAEGISEGQPRKLYGMEWPEGNWLPQSIFDANDAKDLLTKWYSFKDKHLLQLGEQEKDLDKLLIEQKVLKSIDELSPNASSVSNNPVINAIGTVNEMLETGGATDSLTVNNFISTLDDSTRQEVSIYLESLMDDNLGDQEELAKQIKALDEILATQDN